jgi:hypothetical protein
MEQTYIVRYLHLSFWSLTNGERNLFTVCISHPDIKVDEYSFSAFPGKDILEIQAIQALIKKPEPCLRRTYTGIAFDVTFLFVRGSKANQTLIVLFTFPGVKINLLNYNLIKIITV